MTYSVKKLKELLDTLPDHAIVAVESLDGALDTPTFKYTEDTYYRHGSRIEPDLDMDIMGRTLPPLKVLLIK